MPMTMENTTITEQEQKVKEQWETPYKAGSFTSPSMLWRSLKPEDRFSISDKKVVQNMLFAEESYLTNRKVKYHFPRRRVVSSGINYQWDCDVTYSQVQGLQCSIYGVPMLC